ncbi:HAD family hydrolase [Stappia sp. F7233]|uniref:HAD family hydrolase n=1 Tax=Stappia albiluteola TaxID=2758565 RepID=A0A839AG01_9HYPH|nr:HAD family hydrolase [Stappia albiluteola]MBA5778055.1 HAD family hydrolase [Stappia albiluteola]
MALRPPRLLIFDCDGVLVDSEPISIAVLIEVINEAGVPMTAETAYRRFLGRSLATMARIMAEDYGLAVTEAHLEAMRARLYERFRTELRPIPGIRQVLETIGPAFCVASSSQPERIRLSLSVTGLLECFEPHIYSASMVENGKPAPDLFLLAARSMGADPRDCLVIEDSPAGIEAAQRAGMSVFAFTGGSHAGPSGLGATVSTLGPDRIFSDMRDLPRLIASTA